MSCDYWELIGSSPPGGADNLVNEDSLIDVQLDQRHMMLRGDVVCIGIFISLSIFFSFCLFLSLSLKLSKIFRVRSVVTQW